MDVPTMTWAYVGAFVDELVCSGADHVVISPGSRSTPLAMLMNEHESMSVYVHIDERAAAFFALGMAKARRKPVLLVCTSGTAAANYFPAIIEAHHAGVPLIVITADRPHELRDSGAPQTIDQIKLYGDYVKWFREMAVPEASAQLVTYARTSAARAAAEAQSGFPGPVHLNFPFREPLVPARPENKQELYSAELLAADEAISARRTLLTPAVQVSAGQQALTEEQVSQVVALLHKTRKGLIICGPLDDPHFAEAVTKLARQAGYPILADPLSQVRCGTHDLTTVMDKYDTFLRVEEASQALEPELIIRFGATPVSKQILLYLQKHRAARQMVITWAGMWSDPSGMATDVLYVDPLRFCTAVSSAAQLAGPGSWLALWQEVNALTEDAIRTNEPQHQSFEGKVFTELGSVLPSPVVLFAGNSMPVRDMDAYFSKSEHNVRVLANRGANGIDGIVSTALGASVALTKNDQNGQATPLVLVIGDLSFFHDLNGLLPAKWYRLNVTIIIIHNDGGGIFSFLPQATEEKHFEALFGTPLGLDYSAVVNMYGASFARVNEWAAFRHAVQEGVRTEGLSVIEWPTDRAENAKWHKMLNERVGKEIQHFLKNK